MDFRNCDKPRLAYAGNRKIGLKGLELLVNYECIPIALLLPDGEVAEYVDHMYKLVPHVPVFWGKEFCLPGNVEKLEKLGVDYILSVHFPYKIPSNILRIPRIGTLNLHPSYLPYNRGWHTPTWAIMDDTTYGATLHWVDEGIDTGDIALQRKIEIYPHDTAHTLYQRVLQTEETLLNEAIPLLLKRKLSRLPQKEEGTSHSKVEIQSIQKLDLDEVMKVRDVLKILRALTTNKWQEAAFFELEGIRYRVRVEIKKEQ